MGIKETYNKIDWKFTVIAGCLLAFSALVYLFQDETIYLVAAFFRIKDLDLFAGVLATVFTLTHKIKRRKFRFSTTMSFTDFKVPLEDIFSFIGNPITLVCSISLAKGLFLQATQGPKYFPYFKDFEIGFIFLVTTYLLFISVMDLQRNMKDTLVLSIENKSKVTALPKDQVKEDVPDPLH